MQINNNIFEASLPKRNDVTKVDLNQVSNINVANSFGSFLENAKNDKQVQFSKHATTRLNDRDINLSSEQMTRVQQGIVDAKSKGINSGLVLVDDVALVVSVKNSTVITAIDNNSNENKIFTNIDGAIIV